VGQRGVRLAEMQVQLCMVEERVVKGMKGEDKPRVERMYAKRCTMLANEIKKKQVGGDLDGSWKLRFILSIIAIAIGALVFVSLVWLGLDLRFSYPASFGAYFVTILVLKRWWNQPR